MRPFHARGGQYVAELDQAERVVLAQVTEDVLRMLLAETGHDGSPGGPADDGAGGAAMPPWPTGGADRAPRDPAVRRLVPDASHDDADLVDEFRRLTQGELVDTKVQRLALLVERLLTGASRDAPGDGVVVVARDEAARVAGALTDVRLVLAERLGLRTDEQVEGLYDEVVAAAGDGPEEAEDGDGPGPELRLLAGVFLLAGWLQESLVELMLDELRGRSG